MAYWLLTQEWHIDYFLRAGILITYSEMVYRLLTQGWYSDYLQRDDIPITYSGVVSSDLFLCCIKCLRRFSIPLCHDTCHVIFSMSAGGPLSRGSGSGAKIVTFGLVSWWQCGLNGCLNLKYKIFTVNDIYKSLSFFLFLWKARIIDNNQGSSFKQWWSLESGYLTIKEMFPIVHYFILLDHKVVYTGIYISQ